MYVFTISHCTVTTTFERAPASTEKQAKLVQVESYQRKHMALML